MSYSPSEARLRGRIGAHTKWARTPDKTTATEPARRAAATALDVRLAAEFELDPADPSYGERLAHARSAYFARLAFARKRKAGTR